MRSETTKFKRRIRNAIFENDKKANALDQRIRKAKDILVLLEKRKKELKELYKKLC